MNVFDSEMKNPMRLLGLLIASLTIATGCVSKRLPNDLDEDQAAAAVKALGGSIAKDSDLPGQPVMAVKLRLRKAHPDNLRIVKAFTQLRKLDLRGGWRVTDKQLEHLAGLTQLQELSLQDTGITDDGLCHIAGLTRLKSLSLHSCRITGAGLQHFKRMVNLQTLDLSVTKLNDEGLKLLRCCSQLKDLRLDWTEVTSEGLYDLKELKELRNLTVYHTRVGDAGLAYLKALGKLRRIEIWKTRVTDKGIQDLKNALPKLKVQTKGTE